MEDHWLNSIRKRWAEIGQNKTTADWELEVEFYKKMLKVFQAGPSFFMIFMPANAQIDYVSSEVESVLGYTPEEYDVQTFLRNIHPDDKPVFAEFEDKVVDFKMSLPLDKLMKYKSRYDYRMRCSDGTYKRVLQQSVSVQTTAEGKILRNFVVFSDISHLKTHNKLSLSFIGLEGEPSYIDVETNHKYILNHNPLTPREQEIVQLLAHGLSSRETAASLNISPATVATHRKNILAKTGTNSTLELVLKALKNGWV